MSGVFLALVVLLGAWGSSGSGSVPLIVAPKAAGVTDAVVGLDSTILWSSDGSAWTPPACTAVPTGALAAVLGGLVSANQRAADTVLVSCHSTAVTSTNALNDVVVRMPAGTKNAFLGLTPSQGSAGVRTFSAVSGFDEALWHGSTVVIAEDGGRMVEVDVSKVRPASNAAQLADSARWIIGT